MKDDLTLSGEIPGLLRRGSPVVGKAERLGVVVALRHDPKRGMDGAWVAYADGRRDIGWCWFEELALDLTSRTGRVHAAWWAMRAGPTKNWTAAEVFTVACAKDGDPMTDDQIRTLRDLVRRLAGVS